MGEQPRKPASWVMGRMEWLAELKQVFTRVAAQLSERDWQQPVPFEHFIQELSNAALPLEDPAKYYSHTNIVAVSLSEVLRAFVPQPLITWDEVIDVVLQQSREGNVCSEPNGPEHTPSGDLFEVSYPDSKLTGVPEGLLANCLLYVNLAGNALRHTQWKFPSSLVVLNLAGNEISEVRFLNSLPHLKLLNLTNNRVATVTGTGQFRNLAEAFFGYNAIKNFAFFASLERLRLLDASYNNAESLEDVAGLAPLRNLAVVKFKGNPLSHSFDYHLLMQETFGNCQIDPLQLLSFSEFKVEVFPFVPLRRASGTRSQNQAKHTEIQHVATTQVHAEALALLSQSADDLLQSASQYRSKTTTVYSPPLRTPRLASPPQEAARKFVVTKQEIVQSNSKPYSNPVKAVMIGPGGAYAQRTQQVTKVHGKSSS